MKTNETIKQDIRNEISRIIISNIYGDKKRTLNWIIDRLEEYGLPVSIDGLINLSADYSSLLAPNPYNHNAKKMYEVMGLKDIMTYPQFIFELPRIWYTTLYRLIIEWRDEFYDNQDTPY